MSKEFSRYKIVAAMTIAGSDSGAGAGIQADLLTFAANGVYGCTAIAAITAQNPDRVDAVTTPDSNMLVAQMKAIDDYYNPKAAKTGMLFDSKIIESVADFFVTRKCIHLVVDTVMISTSGKKLLKDDAIETLEQKLIPISTLFTPNLDEGAVLLNKESITDIKGDAQRLRDKFNTSVLLKGGHLTGDEIIDVLATIDGELKILSSKRINAVNTHGSGCTLSAAITANIAKGETIFQATKNAQDYIIACMKNPLETAGEKFINHFPKR